MKWSLPVRNNDREYRVPRETNVSPGELAWSKNVPLSVRRACDILRTIGRPAIRCTAYAHNMVMSLSAPARAERGFRSVFTIDRIRFLSVFFPPINVRVRRVVRSPRCAPSYYAQPRTVARQEEVTDVPVVCRPFLMVTRYVRKLVRCRKRKTTITIIPIEKTMDGMLLFFFRPRFFFSAGRSRRNSRRRF